MPLVALEGDPNTHGSGGLIAGNPKTVRIGGIPVIEHADPAQPDSLCFSSGPPHCNPGTAGGSSSVFVYNNPIHRNNDARVCGATTVVESQGTVFAGG